jgi:hypothetical protein
MAAIKRGGNGCLSYEEHGESMRTHLTLLLVFGY